MAVDFGLPRPTDAAVPEMPFANAELAAGSGHTETSRGELSADVLGAAEPRA